MKDQIADIVDNLVACLASYTTVQNQLADYKQATQYIHAKLDRAIRTNGHTDGRTTEANIIAQVRLYPEYQEAIDHEHATQHELNQLAGQLEAIRTRRDLLIAWLGCNWLGTIV